MPTPITPDNALAAMQQYCAYQERCLSDVRDKLRQAKLPSRQIEDILDAIVDEGFINEHRYAVAWLRGHVLNKAWGRKKAQYHLQAKGLKSGTIQAAWTEAIDPATYRANVATLLQKKLATLAEPLSPEDKAKVFRHLAQKGYEASLIYEVWGEATP